MNLNEFIWRFASKIYAAEIFYKETNSQRTIRNMLEYDYKLGIIRYAENI